MVRELSHYVGGQRIDGTSGRFSDVYDPCTGEVQARLPLASAEEVRNAVAAQCEQVADGAGIVAARVAEVCQCSADTFMADPDLTLDDVTRERVEGIVNACAERTAPANGNTANAVTAEEIGG